MFIARVKCFYITFLFSRVLRQKLWSQGIWIWTGRRCFSTHPVNPTGIFGGRFPGTALLSYSCRGQTATREHAPNMVDKKLHYSLYSGNRNNNSILFSYNPTPQFIMTYYLLYVFQTVLVICTIPASSSLSQATFRSANLLYSPQSM